MSSVLLYSGSRIDYLIDLWNNDYHRFVRELPTFAPHLLAIAKAASNQVEWYRNPPEEVEELELEEGASCYGPDNCADCALEEALYQFESTWEKQGKNREK